jgi:hypothetical protein
MRRKDMGSHDDRIDSEGHKDGTVRRETRTDFVNTGVAGDGTVYSDPPTVSVNPSGSASTTAHQTETYTSDPHAVQREGTRRIQGGIYLLFGILEGLLAIRFVLALLGANPAAGFTQFSYSITKPFLAPFVGLFGTARFGGSVFGCKSTGGNHCLRPHRLGAGQSGGTRDGRLAARRAHDIEPDRHARQGRYI